MIIKAPEAGDLEGLKTLWREAFGDTDAFIEAFFSTAFSPSRSRIAVADGPVAALYWFDCQWNGKKLAYIYAVATRKDCRGRGICRQLMEATHKELDRLGYAGALLVPAQKPLFDLYGKMGYRPCCFVTVYDAAAAGAPVKLQKLSAQDYALARRTWLPAGSVEQDGTALEFLGTYCDFYAGEQVLFAAGRNENQVYFQEFFGDTEKIPGILASLDGKTGSVRISGSQRPLAMYRSLDGAEDLPDYFGIPLD